MVKKDFQKKKVLLFAIFFSFFILTVVFLGWLYWPKKAVVYLETGDIYFGDLSLFPIPNLKNAWYLQRDAESGISINPVSTTIWRPASPMMINPKQIVFWAEISQDSTAMQVINSGNPATK